MPDVTSGVFSSYRYEKMWDLFRNHNNEVGVKFPGSRVGKSLTSCIIYVSNVLIYAHQKIGFSDTSYRVQRIEQIGIDEQDGTKLAKYLVNEVGWKAHYWNPDVSDKSRDGTSEHSSSYKDMVVARSSYYYIPISGTIINYNRVNKNTKTVWSSVPVITGPPMFGTVPHINIPVPSSVSTDNLAILKKLSEVKFAFGIARGGYHTFLVSNGEVFEVHWDQIGVKLYGRKAFKDYEFLSGAIIITPDSSFTSDAIK